MATTKTRINVSVEKDVERLLTKLAKRDQVPRATKAAHLIRQALEMEEDDALMILAESRDTKDAKMLSHKDFWKKALGT